MTNRKVALRRIVNEKLYDRPYMAFAQPTEDSSQIPGTADGLDDDNDELDEELRELAARQVRSPATRPYVPPTPMNADSPKPFGSIVDPPVG